MGKNKNLTRKEAFGALIGGIIAIIIFAYFQSRPTTPKLSDKDLFLNFYQEVLQKTKPIDEAYRPFGKALERGELVRAAQVGVKIKDDLVKHYSRFNVKAPDLQNDKAEKEMKEGLEFINIAYMHKINILEEYLEFAKNPSTIIAKTAEMQNSGELYQQRLLQGMARIIGAGSELSIDQKDFTEKKESKGLPGEWIVIKVDEKEKMVHALSVPDNPLVISRDNIEPTLKKAYAAVKKHYPNYSKFKIWFVKTEHAKLTDALGILEEDSGKIKVHISIK